jgi:hypothetical protein
MGLLDGEIAKLVGTALVDAGLSLPAVLTKVTATARASTHPTAATTPTTVDFPCRGFVARLEPYVLRGTLIANATRVVKIYGSTLVGAVPAPGDRITIESTTTTIVDDDNGLQAIQRDSAGAVFTCQCR